MNKDQSDGRRQSGGGRVRRGILTAAVLCGAGCATGAPANERAESSSAAIRAAEEVGANHDPEAALHLQLAKEQYEYAQRLPNPNDKPHADRLLQRAQADAELALALARSDDDRAQARAAIDKVNALKQSATQ